MPLHLGVCVFRGAGGGGAGGGALGAGGCRRGGPGGAVQVESYCTRVETSLVSALETKQRLTDFTCSFQRPISVYRFPRRALTLCPQLCMGIQPDARFSARSADALPATLYGHFTQAICVIPKSAYFNLRPFSPTWQAAGVLAFGLVVGRGSHSSTFQLNLSRF